MFYQTNRTKAPVITPSIDGIVPSAAAAHCLQRVHTICMLTKGGGSAKRIFLPGNLHL